MEPKQSAQQVLDILAHGSYSTPGGTVTLATRQKVAVDRTQLYSPDQLVELRKSTETNVPKPSVFVADDSTQDAAQKLATSGPVALLNFASARNPGGGFLRGAKAQEEDLCRCSGLYLCLLEAMTYYQTNRKQRSLLYTDYAIYSPTVPFFRTTGTGPLLAELFTASVITAPAPNTRPFLEKYPNEMTLLEATFLRRWQNVLQIAKDQNQSRVLLGAWGCGAFGGDPAMAARTALQAIESHGAGLDEIHFAIPNKGKLGQRNFDTFSDTFT